MDVWIVIYNGWDYAQIEGVYVSLEKAKEFRPKALWKADAEGGASADVPEGGLVLSIEKHTVQG